VTSISNVPRIETEYVVLRELSNSDMYTGMMPLEGIDIILGYFELLHYFFLRTNKMVPPPINVQSSSTPIKIRMIFIMEDPKLTVINM
jgi:hypothetical protein